METKQKDIFISYCRRDIEKVKRIKQEIETETLAQCWMDLEGIESGNPKFTKIIVRAINSCPIFLFMLSEASQQSENALKELDFAYDKYHEEGKKVVIVYIEPCKMNDEFKFDYQKADTIDWQNPLQREKLIRDLKVWTNYEAKLEKSNKGKEQLALAEAEAQRQTEEARKKREEEALRKVEAERKRKEEQQKRKEQRVALFSSFISLFRQNFMKKSTIWWVSGGMVTILIIVFGLRLGNTQDHELSSEISSVTENIKIEKNKTKNVEDIKSTDIKTEKNIHQVATTEKVAINSHTSVKSKDDNQNDEHLNKKVTHSDSSKTDTVSTLLLMAKKMEMIRDSLVKKESTKKSNVDIWLEAAKSQLEYEKNEEPETLKYSEINWELERNAASAKLKRINPQLESYEQLVSEESEKTAPTFQLR